MSTTHVSGFFFFSSEDSSKMLLLSDCFSALSIHVYPLFPGYYFEIRSICAIRINTQVGLSGASNTADPHWLVLFPPPPPTSSPLPHTLMLLVVKLTLVVISSGLTGVPWRSGSPNGSGRQWCQTGSVDQCVPGCFGNTADSSTIFLNKNTTKYYYCHYYCVPGRLCYYRC